MTKAIFTSSPPSDKTTRPKTEPNDPSALPREDFESSTSCREDLDWTTSAVESTENCTSSYTCRKLIRTHILGK
jgi:hypothetical protein